MDPEETTLVYMRVEGYTIEEIALATDRSKSTVKRVLSDVKARAESGVRRRRRKEAEKVSFSRDG